MSNSTNVLLIEDSQSQAALIRELLRDPDFAPRNVDLVSRLADGLTRLKQGGIDVVLTDLGLPDSQGLETVIRLRAQSPKTPIVVLTSLDDEDIAAAALQQGAQDYLIKSEVNANWLSRSLRYAIARHNLQPVAEAYQEPTESVEPVAEEHLDVQSTGGTTTVELLAGILIDPVTTGHVAKQIDDITNAGCRELIFSLASVEYLSNVAIAMLMTVHKKMRDAGGRMLLSNLSDSVRDAIVIRKLQNVFDIEPPESA